MSTDKLVHLTERPHPQPLSHPMGEGGVGLSPARRGSEIPEQPCVTRFELAALLRVSVRTVDRMIAAGELPVRRVRGRAVRFLRSDVERYLSGSTDSTPHPSPLPDRGGEGASRTGHLPETNLLKSNPAPSAP